MSTEVDSQGALERTPDAPQLTAGPEVPDHLRDLRVIKRWTWVGVFVALLVSLPARHFLVGSSLIEMVASLMVGVIIATFAIHGAFVHGFKLKKRSAYPEDVFLQFGALPTFDVGCQAAVSIMDRLLGLSGSFLALHNQSGFLGLMALSSVSRVNA
ncbi:MAG: hypothetical protein E3J29_01360, partial [Dehalococcoidia bacterium]